MRKIDHLGDLCLAEIFPCALGLDGKNKLFAVNVQPHIEIVNLTLAFVFNRGSPVVLQVVARNLKENVQQPIVMHFGKQALFVASSFVLVGLWFARNLPGKPLPSDEEGEAPAVAAPEEPEAMALA